MMFNRKATVNPPIFADLLVETSGQVARLNVEQSGYLEQFQAILPLASRVGLALRNKDAAVWVAVNGSAPHYYSQVSGELFGGQRQTRVACLDCGDYQTWLHKDGLVEIGPVPTVRW